MIINAVNACDADVLPQLLSNIVLVGGSTLLPGFPERLQHEMNVAAAGVRCSLSFRGAQANISKPSLVQDKIARGWSVFREKICLLARRLYTLFVRHLSSAVDLQGGIRGARKIDCPQTNKVNV